MARFGERRGKAHQRRFELELAVAIKAPRLVDGGLDVEAAVDQRADDAALADRLERTAGHAEGGDHAAITRQHAGDDGVEGTLAGCEAHWDGPARG